jgi:two-component system NtrC family sensor kinase
VKDSINGMKFSATAQTNPLDIFSWSQLTLDIVAAPTLARLQEVALLGALKISGADAGALSLLRDDFDSHNIANSAKNLADSETLRIPWDAPVEHSGWRHYPLRRDDIELGCLSLLKRDSEDFQPNEWIELLCEHVAAVAAKTRLFEQLQYIKREWQAMLDGMIDGVYVCNLKGEILRANRALANMLGLEISAVLGRKRDELWHQLPEYNVLRPWQPLDFGPAHLSPQITEFRCGQPDRVFVEMAFELHVGTQPADRIEDGRRLCVLHDVTESRRLQEQLLQSEKLAALGELTSGVAHELNNPLATVVGYAELLDLDSTLPEGVKRKLSTIHQEATRASHIVSNLLAYARRSSPEKSFVSINSVLEAVVGMRRYQLATDDVRIVTNFCDNLAPVWADSLQLQQVLLNIVNNGVQAVQNWRGSGEIRISSKAAILNGNPAVRVIIEDNGPGIAPEHLRRVFDPFFTTKPTGEGTGLGMSIALRIISNHEGLIWAESRLGHGARFIIELPGATGNDGVYALPEELIQTSVDDFTDDKPAHILVIDDEEPVVTLMTEILAMDGHTVTPAFNGAEAIALLKATDFDLILSDVRMPAVGGPTFFEILQTTRPDLLPKVIFVTGDTMSSSTQEFLQRADRPVLAKPFDPDRLRSLVNDSLRELQE